MRIEHPQFLLAADSLLVVIDEQERLVPAMDAALGPQAVARTRLLIESARDVGVPILVSEQYPRGLGDTVPELREVLGDVPRLPKTELAFTENDALLRALAAFNRRRIVLTGMETHVCVYQSALGLLALGYDVHLVTDATASRASADHTVGLNLAAAAGALPTCSEAVVFQWLERAGHPAFKRVQKRII